MKKDEVWLSVCEADCSETEERSLTDCKPATKVLPTLP